MDECKPLPAAAAMTVQTGNRLENMSLNLVKVEGPVMAAARTVTTPPRPREPRACRVGVELTRSAVVMSTRPTRTDRAPEEAETETPPRAPEEPPVRDKVACTVTFLEEAVGRPTLLEEAVGRAAVRTPDRAGAAKEAARVVILRGSLGDGE